LRSFISLEIIHCIHLADAPVDAVAAFIVAASGHATLGAKTPVHDFRDLKDRSWIENFRELMSSRVDYSTTLPIGISDHNQKVVLFHITVLIRSAFLKHDGYPTLKILGLTFASTLFIAVFLASLLRIRHPMTPDIVPNI
jgi:hypothetical protein